jgi:hypothetical protein
MRHIRLICEYLVAQVHERGWTDERNSGQAHWTTAANFDGGVGSGPAPP